jgi:lipopolysaccharide biosynthesis regulator YciM
MLTGRLHAEDDHHADAVTAYEARSSRHRVRSGDPAAAAQQLCTFSADGARRGFLREMLARYHGISPCWHLTHLYQQRDGERAAIDFLTSQLRLRPSVRGLMALIDATMDKIEGEARENFLILRDLTKKLLEGQAMYRCSRLRLRRQGASLAVPQLQELEHDPSDPWRRQRVT